MKPRQIVHQRRKLTRGRWADAWAVATAELEKTPRKAPPGTTAAFFVLRSSFLVFTGLIGLSGLCRADAAQSSCANLAPFSVPEEAMAYVEAAWASNLALKTRSLDLELARARLTEARSRFEPRVDVLARFTRAEGGRSIDLPIGDLLNPAYATLNEWLIREGRPASFSPVQNQSFALIREREQETTLRLVQPLYRPEIYHRTRAARADLAANEATLAVFRRELRLTVLIAYFRFLQSESSLQVLDTATELTAEAERAQRILYESGRATQDRVLRAEAESLGAKQQRSEAERDRDTARAYLNFLADRPLGQAVVATEREELNRIARFIAAQRPAPLNAARREELLVQERAVSATRANEAAVAARRKPSLGFAVEGGIQGENYRTGGSARFIRGSLVGEWSIWDGGEKRSQQRQAALLRNRQEIILASLRQQIALEIDQAEKTLEAAVIALEAGTAREAAATRAFELVRERESEGLINQLAFLDARHERTRAELGQIVAVYQLLAAAATLDRVAAITPLL